LQTLFKSIKNRSVICRTQKKTLVSWMSDTDTVYMCLRLVHARVVSFYTALMKLVIIDVFISVVIRTHYCFFYLEISVKLLRLIFKRTLV